MPPPPGSRSTDLQRSLWLGMTRGTVLDTSIAGFMVKVTMLTAASSRCGDGVCRQGRLDVP
jgi:hypothetical protein